MLAIKLQRVGKKHQPSFRIVVAEKRSKLGSPPVEDIGSYNPSTKAVSAQKDKIAYWIKSGAKPTPTAWNLLVKAGAVSGPKVAIKIRKPEKTGVKTEASAATAAPETPGATETVVPAEMSEPIADVQTTPTE